MILRNINTLKEVINMLDKENLLIEISIQSNKLKKLNNIIHNFNFERIENQQIYINDLFGNSKQKKDIDTLFSKFIHLLAKHLWCLYFTDKTTYDILKKFYLDLYKIDISTFSNGDFTEENLKKYISDDYIPINTTASSGSNVTHIKDYEFSDKGLTSVIIPQGTKTIGKNAYAFNNLTHVTIPESVTNIDNYAFNNNKLASVSIGNKVTLIGDGAFTNNKLKSIIIPDSVTRLGEYAFDSNELTNVEIGNNVTFIGKCAFLGNKLKNVTMPAKFNNDMEKARIFDDNFTQIVFTIHKPTINPTIIPVDTSIGDYEFADKGLTSVIIPQGTKTIGIRAFSDNKLTNVIIPDSVISIGYNAFIKNQLTDVTIPDYVISIGDRAFMNNQLTTVKIGKRVTSIGNGAFINNQLRGNVKIPGSVTSIGSDAFNKNQLTSVEIPDSITSIGNGVFSNNQLTDVKIPESVTSIGSNAFSNNQLTDVKIPDLVISIGSYAFSNNQLTSITIPESVANIDLYAFINNQLTTVTMPASFDTDTAKANIFGDNFKKIIFIIHTPNTDIEAIVDFEFQYKALKNVIIPKSVKTIGRYAYANNELKNVYIPKSVTSIGEYAFAENQLTNMTIGNNVTSIGEYAFYKNQLKSVDIGNKITIIGNSAFEQNQLTSVKIPDLVTSISNGAFNKNQLTRVEIPDSVTSIGIGAFDQNQLTSVHIGHNVESIGFNAFSNNKLTDVYIPDSVTSIGNYAYYNNELTIVSIGNKVESIGTGAFANNKLTNVIIPESVTEIDSHAFFTNKLTSVIIPESVTQIGKNAFSDNKLTHVTMPARFDTDEEKANIFGDNFTNIIFTKHVVIPIDRDETIISINAFKNKGLTSVMIPQSVTIIEDFAFANNELSSVIIPDSVTRIGDFAFHSNKLTRVTIGKKVTRIGANAFQYNDLTHVEIPESVTYIGHGAFQYNDFIKVKLPVIFNNFKERTRIFGANPSKIDFFSIIPSSKPTPIVKPTNFSFSDFEKGNLDTGNFFHDLDYDPDRKSISLQRMMKDMRNRKKNNMLYMPDDENHPVNENKINEWIDLQCDVDAKTIAQLFKKHKKYISWKQFYEKSIQVFEMLYNFVGDKSYCIFTKEVMSGVNFNDKSTYWMIQLMLDYFINTNKTNFPKELLLCSKTTCPSSNYDYYIVLDDCIYSGGQVFDDVILINNITTDKIIVVAPYISRNALDIYGSSTRYKKCFHAEIMENWWKDKTVKLSTGTFNLNNKLELASVLQLFDRYFPSPRENSVWTYKNLMYFFDHKIADYASAFPTAYQIGLISPLKQLSGLKQLAKISSNTYDDLKNPSSNEVCLKQTYLPFLENCFNDKPVFYDITEVHKTHPENLCVMPWYKKKYEENQIDKKVLVFDFDNTLVKGDYTDQDIQIINKPLNEIFVNMLKFKEILNIAWEKLMPIYIVSRRPKDIIVYLLNRFYKEENISIEKQLYNENILGRNSIFMYPNKFDYAEIDKFWASRKVRYLNFIVDLEKVNKSDVLFCDSKLLNISKAKKDGFVNLILIDKTKNTEQVMDAINNFISNPTDKLTSSTTQPVSKFAILNILSNKTTKLNISNINTGLYLLDKDYDPNRKSVSLQRMIRDMRIRKNKNMLYMEKSENFPINEAKLDEWINLQCNTDAKILARLFKSNTKYISWEQFYKKSKEVFEQLYNIVGDKSSYCIFTNEKLTGGVNFNKKSNYWMIQLMLDYFTETNKTNLPKELLLCDKSTCPSSNYDYYIVIDDCSYSGSQLFGEQFKITPTTDPNKIIVVAPYISEYAIEKYHSNKSNKFKECIYGWQMEKWWKDKTVVLSSGTYHLNILTDLDEVLKLIGKYFPSRTSYDIPNEANLMYYFDHKVADYVSTFPSVYHTGIITPDRTTSPRASKYTYDDNGSDSPACAQRTYLPFVDNCSNNKPTLADVEYTAALRNPKNLCVDTWYKREYDDIQIDKKVLVFDFDDTLVDGKFTDEEINTKPLNEIFVNKLELIEILNIAWKKLMPVYIISRRKNELIVDLLNRFYKAENVPIYLQIYKENILGRPKEFVYPVEVNTNEELKKQFWASRKVKYLNHIISLENIDESDILFCDDLQININKAKENGFVNSIVIDEKENAKQVIVEVNKFAPSIDYKQKYLKYKLKYLKLKKY